MIQYILGHPCLIQNKLLQLAHLQFSERHSAWSHSDLESSYTALGNSALSLSCGKQFLFRARAKEDFRASLGCEVCCGLVCHKESALQDQADTLIIDLFMVVKRCCVESLLTTYRSPANCQSSKAKREPFAIWETVPDELANQPQLTLSTRQWDTKQIEES